jgi:hypothetical protein
MTPPDDSAEVAARTAIVVLVVVTLAVAVAITGALWLAVSTGPETTPQMIITWQEDGQTLTAVHAGGDAVPARQLTVVSESLTNSGDSLPETDQYGPESTFREGDQITIGAGHYEWTNSSETATVRLVWTSSDGEDYGTVDVWEGVTGRTPAPPYGKGLTRRDGAPIGETYRLGHSAGESLFAPRDQHRVCRSRRAG